MKKKHIAITLLVAGITLLCASLIFAVIAAGNKSIIGGADWPTFTFVFFHEKRGLFSALAYCGAILICTSAFIGFKKDN